MAWHFSIIASVLVFVPIVNGFARLNPRQSAVNYRQQVSSSPLSQTSREKQNFNNLVEGQQLFPVRHSPLGAMEKNKDQTDSPNSNFNDESAEKQKAKAKTKASLQRTETVKSIFTDDRINDFFIMLYNFLPIVSSVLAFNSFDLTESIFHDFLSAVIQDLKWVAVDGGTYQASLLAPLINGIVLPAISIALATLVGVTISTLQQRQIVTRTCLNKEATNLRMLLHNIQNIFDIDHIDFDSGGDEGSVVVGGGGGAGSSSGSLSRLSSVSSIDRERFMGESYALVLLLRYTTNMLEECHSKRIGVVDLTKRARSTITDVMNAFNLNPAATAAEDEEKDKEKEMESSTQNDDGLALSPLTPSPTTTTSTTSSSGSSSASGSGSGRQSSSGLYLPPLLLTPANSASSFYAYPYSDSRSISRTSRTTGATSGNLQSLAGMRPRTAEIDLQDLYSYLGRECRRRRQRRVEGGEEDVLLAPELDLLPSLVTCLNEQRSLRLATLDTSFPVIHWVVLSILSSSILVGFLLESDNNQILFLDGVQLRILFTMLVGGATSTALLIFDLLQPFGRGPVFSWDDLTPSEFSTTVVRRAKRGDGAIGVLIKLIEDVETELRQLIMR